MPNGEKFLSGESEPDNARSEFDNVDNKDSSIIQFATQPLHVIWVYLKGDPHRAAYQIPLEAVPTWNKLESVLRLILNAEGQLVLNGCDDEAIVLPILWPYYLRSGAKFSFSYRPLIEIEILDNIGVQMLTVNLDESEGIFFLRRFAHAYLQSLTPPCKCPLNVQDLQLRNLIFDDPLTESLLQDDVLLADVVQRGQGTLTLVATNVEAYANEKENFNMKDCHTAMETLADDDHLEKEVSKMKKPVGEEVLAHDMDPDEDVSEVDRFSTAQEILASKDFRNEDEAQKMARTLSNWHAALKLHRLLYNDDTPGLSTAPRPSTVLQDPSEPLTAEQLQFSRDWETRCALVSKCPHDEEDVPPQQETFSTSYIEADELNSELSPAASESGSVDLIELQPRSCQSPGGHLKPPSPTIKPSPFASGIHAAPSTSITTSPSILTPATSSRPTTGLSEENNFERLKNMLLEMDRMRKPDPEMEQSEILWTATKRELVAKFRAMHEAKEQEMNTESTAGAGGLQEGPSQEGPSQEGPSLRELDFGFEW